MHHFLKRKNLLIFLSKAQKVSDFCQKNEKSNLITSKWTKLEYPELEKDDIYIKEIKEDMKRKTGAGENYLQSRVFEIVRDIMGIIIENRELNENQRTEYKTNLCPIRFQIKSTTVKFISQ